MEWRGYNTTSRETSAEKVFGGNAFEIRLLLCSYSVYSGVVQLQLDCSIALVQMEAEK